MFCTNCGAELLNETFKFCPNCGSSVKQAVPSLIEDNPESIPVPKMQDPDVQKEPSIEENTAAIPEEPIPPASPDEKEAEEVILLEAPLEEPEPPSVLNESTEEEPIQEAEVLDTISEKTAAPEKTEEVKKEIPVSNPDSAQKKPLHFTATISIVLAALSFVLGTFCLLGLLTSMHPGIIIFLSILLLQTTPLAFGFGIASFIIGLKNRKPAGWIIGLVATALSVCSFIAGFIYLIAGIASAA